MTPENTLTRRTVIDRQEFERLIRKHRSVSLCVFGTEHVRESVVPGCSSGVFALRLPAKLAIEKLRSGEFDAFVWVARESGPEVSTTDAAPAWLQIARARQIIQAKLFRFETQWAPRASDASIKDWAVAAIARYRRELQELDAQSAALRSQPSAA